MSGPDRVSETTASSPFPGGPASPVSDEEAGPAGVPPHAELGRADGDLGVTVVALTDNDIEQAQRRRLLRNLVGQVRARGLGDMFKPRAAIAWLTSVVSEVAPHIPVRDHETLRRHFDGLDGDLLAERLVRNAARATAGVGAAGGGVAAVEWAAAPTLLSAPVLLAAETVAVVAIEIKLIGELHEVYGVPFTGSGTQRAVGMIHSWASRRGVNPMVPGVGVGTVLGTAARKELRDTLLRRFGRNLTTMGPLLTGAAVASFLNSRATRKLGDQIRADLRGGPGTAIAPVPPNHG